LRRFCAISCPCQEDASFGLFGLPPAFCVLLGVCFFGYVLSSVLFVDIWKGVFVSTLKEQLEADLKQAMRTQNALETSVLRMAKSALQYKAVEPNAKPLSDMDVLEVLRKLIKQRKDAAEQFRHANREELASKEESEIVILQRYLPQPFSAEALSQVVRQAIAELGVSGPKSFGLVMKKVMEQLQGRSEGKAISEEVKKQLG